MTKSISKFLGLGIACSAILAAFTGCNRASFKKFDVKDTGPKTYLMTGVNQLENGDFSLGEKHWGKFINTGGNAEISVKNQEAKITVKNAGGVEYAIQYYYDGFRIYHDGQYVLTFTASSTLPKGCEVRIQLNGGDFHAYAIDTFTFDKEEKTYSISFTMTDDSDVAPRLAFNMGCLPKYDNYNEGDRPVVTLKDVSLVLKNTIAEDEKSNGGADFVRLNQVGYKPGDKKIAYAKVTKNGLKFSVLDQSGSSVLEGKLGNPVRDEMAQEYTAPADFSKLTTPGTYTVVVDGNASFPFVISDSVYDEIMLSTLRYFTLARCGSAIEDDIYGHPACHTNIAFTTNRRVQKDVTGGWHDAGDYGRYVVPGAKSVADLLLAYNTLKDSSIKFDILNEVRYELEWMLKMQTEDGGVYHKVTCSGFPPFEMPEEEKEMLFLSAVSTAATADFVASAALAYNYYKDTDSDFAKALLTAADKSWSYLEAHPYKKFKNESFIYTGEYPDRSDADERYFAASAMAIAKAEKNGKFAAEAEKIRNSDWGQLWNEQFGWEQMEGYGDDIILSNPEYFSAALVKTVQKKVSDQAKISLKNIKASGFNQAQAEVGWGSNMEAMNIAHLLILADKTGKDTKFLEGAKNQIDYILGANPMTRCYVTGFGSNPPMHPHHRPSIAKDIPQAGMMVGGPDQNLEDEFAINLVSDKPALQCYVDNYQSFSTNEITIYWNSAFAYALAALYY